MRRDCVEIDKDSLDFLYAVYFGNYEDEFHVSANRAYRDMNRTLRFNGLRQEDRDNLRKMALGVIQRKVDELWHKDSVDQVAYDLWHKNLAERMVDLYNEYGVSFTIGQAQKWINMTMKYLYVFGKPEMKELSSVCHVPLDNYIFEIASSDLQIEKPRIPWSRWNDYSNQYMHYQNLLREKLVGEIPFKWEFRAWLDSARRSIR